MQGNQTMAKFRARIEQLTIKKESEQGKRMTQKELAAASEVPIATLSRWSNHELDRIDADTVLRLQTYFKCSLDELIEIVE